MTSSSSTPRAVFRQRVVLISCLALLPLALLAQGGGGQQPSTALSPGAAVAIPFSGPGWQDKVLNYEGYVMPPPALAAAVLAPRDLNVTLSNPSPDHKWFLDELNDGPVPMSIFGKPFDEMGGVFIDWKANRLRSVTLRNTTGIQLISTTDGTHKMLATPAGQRVTNARWTQDGTGVMYMVLADDSTHVWVTDVATNKPRQITKSSLLTTFVTNFQVINGGKQIVAVFPPDGRTARPMPPVVPAGPEVRISEDSDKNRLRTFPSLMNNMYDYKLLEWHATGQIGIVDVATGVVTKFGKPEMITAVDMNPTGAYARVTVMTKPFSIIVPVSSFGSVEQVWDNTGKSLAELSKRELNLGVAADTTPDPPDPTQTPAPGQTPAAPAAAGGGGGRQGGGAQNGKRELTWRADGQGFNYLQLEPAPEPPAGATGGRNGGRAGGGQAAAAGGRQGGNAQTPAGPPRKDRLMQWTPPFGDKDVKQLYENPTQMTGIRYSPDNTIMFFTENGATVAMFMNDMTTKYTIARGGGGNRGGAGGGNNATPSDPNAATPPAGGQANGRGAGGGADAGTLMAVAGGGGGGRAGGGGRGGGGGGGGPVLLSSDGTSVFLQGSINPGRGSADAPKPYIDKVNIKTGERTRVFEGDNSNKMIESITAVLDNDVKKIVLSRQNQTTPPQQFLFDSGARKQLTNNEDLFPDLTRMTIQRFNVTRADGFTFKTIVYLPADYKQGTRMPAFFWFYPAEFTSQEAYDNPGRGGGGGGGAPANPDAPRAFQSFGTLSKQFLVRLGYVVIENDAPIVGPNGEMNNNYVNDLRNDLSATIDELDRRQLIDRQRLAIGGHSYGAFSTVNAMVNTPFFKAGIAGDGAYNRTLTPLGFQNERRDIWQAPNVYLDMSPFLKANQMTGALLMYHGMHDQNVGTDPINSLRLFHALNGLGKTVALYRYPNEDHGPAARETLLDLWSRWAAWLDKYVMNPQPVNKPAPAPVTPGGRGGGR